MGRVDRVIAKRTKLLAKAHKFNRQQQKVARMHPAVYEAMELLATDQLVWDADFEAIRKPLLTVIRNEARTGLHLRDLETLCKRIADAGENL